MLRPKLQKDKRVKPRAAGASAAGGSRSRSQGRGMLYENETMRLRALEMASEAERHSGDVRRLRRENQRLKQQVHSVRDEYDRLERFVDELEQLAATGSGVDASNAVVVPVPAICEPLQQHKEAGECMVNGASVEPQREDLELCSPLSIADITNMVTGSFGHLNLDRLLDVALDFHVDRLNGCVMTSANGGVPNHSTHSEAVDKSISANSTLAKCSGSTIAFDPVAGGLAALRYASVQPLTVVFSVRHCAALVELSVCDVVNDLQRQYSVIDSTVKSDETDATLDVQCVRVDGDAVFITCRRRCDVDRLLRGGLQVRGHYVQLADVMNDSVLVEVDRVPVYVNDDNVHELVSTFGTVIGPVERRLYGGVDTGRRRVRVRLRDEVTLPQQVTVAGNRFTVHVLGEFESAATDGCVSVASDPSMASVNVDTGQNSNRLSATLPSHCPPYSVAVSNASTRQVLSSLLRWQPPVTAADETRVKHCVKPLVRSPTVTSHRTLTPPKPSYHLIASGPRCDQAVDGAANTHYGSNQAGSRLRHPAPDPPGSNSTDGPAGCTSSSPANPASTVVTSTAVTSTAVTSTAVTSTAVTSTAAPLDPLRVKLAQRARLAGDTVSLASERRRLSTEQASDLLSGQPERRDSDPADSAASSSRQLAPDSKSQESGSQDGAELPWCGCWGLCCF